MAQPTYTARVLVLRKTKLGESDLIVTLLAEDGAQLRAVAKGARKPSNAFSARLELYSVADVLCSKGRSLDTVCEARLVESNERLRRDMEHAAAAAPMVELLDRVAQLGLKDPKLFACAQAALSLMGKVDGPRVCTLCAAHLLKTLAFSGLRPSLDTCVLCGAEVTKRGGGAQSVRADDVVYVSYREGGVVCTACRPHATVVALPQNTVAWMRYLLASTFVDIAESDMDLGVAFSALRFCQQWVREHVGANLKSLDFLFSCGLFEEDVV